MDNAVSEIRLGDIILSRQVIRTAKELLSPMLEYLMDSTPETNFYAHDDGFELHEVAFENPDNCDRLIIRDKAMWIQIGAVEQAIPLAQYDSFKNMIGLTPDKMMKLTEEEKTHLERKNSEFREWKYH